MNKDLQDKSIKNSKSEMEDGAEMWEETSDKIFPLCKPQQPESRPQMESSCPQTLGRDGE